ncbi:MAG: hypothetical protein ACOC80_16370 [Petrotogales bacterium]
MAIDSDVGYLKTPKIFFGKVFSLTCTFICSIKVAGVPERSKGQGLGVLIGLNKIYKITESEKNYILQYK